MKLSHISLWSLALAGCLPAVRAESWNQFPESGPETTLDSMWASAAYVQTLVEASSAQINISRFQQKGPSNLWAGALGSFGDGGARNNQPSFDYPPPATRWDMTTARMEKNPVPCWGWRSGNCSGTRTFRKCRTIRTAPSRGTASGSLRGWPTCTAPTSGKRGRGPACFLLRMRPSAVRKTNAATMMRGETPPGGTRKRSRWVFPPPGAIR